MDDYLFIAFAKLKADLAKFERQRLPAAPPADADAPESSYRSPRARRQAPEPAELAQLSVVSTHGLRGWS